MRVGFGLASVAALLTLAVGSIALAAPPLAEDQQDGPRLELPLEGTVTNPNWDATPSGDDLAHLYPPLAQMLELEGRASIVCGVATDGALFGCKVASEVPAGLGFGYATLLAAVDFHMKPGKIDGKPVKGQVTIPLSWKLNADQTPKLPPSALEEPTPLPERLALAHRMLVATDAEETIVQRMDEQVRQRLEQAESNGSPAPAPDQQQMVLKLFHQGQVKAAIEFIDWRAHRIAVRLSQADLESAVRFLESPAGRAVTAEETQFYKDYKLEGQRLWPAASAQARAAFCRQSNCVGVDAPRSSLAPGVAEPSTR